MTASVAHLTAVGAAITSGAIVARPYAREWWVAPGRLIEVADLLPEDPWGGACYPDDAPTCTAVHGTTGRPCIRLDEHTGRDLAAIDGRIIAVWGTR